MVFECSVSRVAAQELSLRIWGPISHSLTANNCPIALLLKTSHERAYPTLTRLQWLTRRLLPA
jgi:hypothetical protein